jgi:1-aminocyclopropane-1-carboxylate deaminase/D-cysteine desulfhydrase-like pyridoxal-dependent ACC family enzyme
VPERPLLRRFPGLAALPRADFGAFPTPVETLSLAGGATLMVKRDDLSGRVIGGNKVRGLEWVLGDLHAGEHVLTVGPRGSTHALATALCAHALGAKTTVVRWNQVMNDAARRVDGRLYRAARVVDAIWVPPAYAIAVSLRVGRTRWIGAGGATPVALLGHADAALELVEQAARRECALPARVFVPFGTGSTAAGLALGFRIAGVSTRVVGVRVAPRIASRYGRALTLARRTASLIERLSGARVPRVGPLDLTIDHAFYGGKYGRPLAKPSEHERSLSLTGVRLDDTYSRKAFAAAAAHAASHEERTMFWMTFDSRLLT